MENKYLQFQMRNLLFVSLVLLLCAGRASLNAQVANYRFSQSSGTYTPLNNATTIAVATGASGAAGLSNVSFPVELPFPFKYNDVLYDTCYVVSNGFISFGTGNYLGTTPISVASAAGLKGVVAAMGGNLWGVYGTSGTITKDSTTIKNVNDFNGLAIGKSIVGFGLPVGTTVVSFNTVAKTIEISAKPTSTYALTSIRWGIGEIKTAVSGVRPNRKFTIEYSRFSDNSTSTTNNTAFDFQIQLEESSNRINVIYGPFTSSANSMQTMQVGLRGILNSDFNNRTATLGTSWNTTLPGTASYAVIGRNNTNFPASGLTFSWEPSTCHFPTISNFYAFSSTGVTVEWDAPLSGNPPSGYLWEVRVSGAPGSGSTGLAANGGTTGNSAVINGLSANTSYSIYLRTDCGGNNFSNWTMAKVFKTPCASVETTPYLETFTTFLNYLTLPACWTSATGYLKPVTKFSVSPSVNITWMPTTWQNDFTDKAAVTTLSAENKCEWLISPSIDLGSAGNKQVDFDLMIQESSGRRDTVLGADDTLALVISTDNGLTWSENNIIKVWTASNTPLAGSYVAIPLSGYTGIVRFGLYTAEGVLDKMEKITINNFAVKDAPCFTVKIGKDISVCNDGKRRDTLDAGYIQGAQYSWDDLSAGQTRIVNASGVYTVAVSKNGCTVRDSIKVTYNPYPVSQLGNDTTICGRDTFLLVAADAGTYVSWSVAGLPGPANASTLPATLSGVYTARINDRNGCNTVDTIVVRLIKALPFVQLGNDTVVCDGNNFLLDAGNPGLTNLWNDNSQEQTKKVTSSGTYSVKVTDLDGCFSTDTIRIEVLPGALVNLGNDTGICQGNHLVLDAGTGGVKYLWENGSTDSRRRVDTSGQYSVSVTSGNECVVTDTINVTVHLMPVVDSISVKSIRDGLYSFSVRGGRNIVSYEWDFGDGTPIGSRESEMHQYSKDGVYKVVFTAKGSGDCGTYSDTIEINLTTLGIGSNSVGNPEIILFPNPGEGIFQLKYPLYFKHKSFAVYNVNGVKVFSSNFNASGMQEMNLSTLVSGTYCLLIIDENGVWTPIKFIIRK